MIYKIATALYIVYNYIKSTKMIVRLKPNAPKDEILYLEFDKEYIVMSMVKYQRTYTEILNIIDPDEWDYLIPYEGFNGYIFPASCFEVVVSTFPPQWVKLCNGNTYKEFYGFKEFFEDDFINNLNNSMIKEVELFKYYHNIYVRWHYDLEVEDFFKNTNLSNLQKQDMIEYYKSQPTREQWDKDAEFLSEYIVK